MHAGYNDQLGSFLNDVMSSYCRHIVKAYVTLAVFPEQKVGQMFKWLRKCNHVPVKTMFTMDVRNSNSVRVS